MKTMIALFAFGLMTATAHSQDAATRQKHFLLTDNHVAIQGYDPVSYFQSGPKEGSKSISYAHKGVTYYFANEANKNLFIADPDKYEPAWGGWCGHAMALRGEKVEIDPKTYKIVNGRNVLFYKSFWANALTNWNKEKTPEAELMKMGDKFWSGIVGSGAK